MWLVSWCDSRLDVTQVLMWLESWCDLRPALSDTWLDLNSSGKSLMWTDLDLRHNWTGFWDSDLDRLCLKVFRDKWPPTPRHSLCFGLSSAGWSSRVHDALSPLSFSVSRSLCLSLAQVQGMSSIAAVLILNMDELEAFVGFSNLINRPCQLAFYRADHQLVQKHTHICLSIPVRALSGRMHRR